MTGPSHNRPRERREGRYKVRTALVHDWLTGMRGGEKCLEVFCELFPEATLFTLVHLDGTVSRRIETMRIQTTGLSRLPGVSRYYRSLLPVFPWLVESLDLSAYNLVLSSSHCVAKGVRVPPGALHISYIYTPMRYVWDLYEDYFGRASAGLVRGGLMRILRRRLQRWDAATASRVDHFVAISHHVADRVRRHYGRGSTVIYPPVETDRFRIRQGAGEFYLVVSAFAPYKRVDLAIQACNLLQRPLKIVGTGQEARRLKTMAGPTVEFLDWRPDEEVAELYSRCRALLFPGVEDFGITPLEAMASGRPVIAYARGGALESVVPLTPDSGRPVGLGRSPVRMTDGAEGPTGIFFSDQSTAGLIRAIELFEANASHFDPNTLRQWAQTFDRQVFKERMAALVAERWAEHLRRLRQSAC